MSGTTAFVIGTPVACSDRECGQLQGILIDPAAKTLTHLVVERGLIDPMGHIVPLDLVESTTDQIRLRCTILQFENLEEAEETKFLPGAMGEYVYKQSHQVHATDGTIGRVQGLVVDPTDYQVTHVLLDEGHLWGEKEVSIPISAVTSVGVGIQLNLTRDEIRDLPAI
jgi:sporulation protein YlmC with PRC-barrel domain